MPIKIPLPLLAVFLAGAASGTILAQDKAPEKMGTLDAPEPAPRMTRGRDLLFSADGKRLLFCGADGAHVWDVADGKPLLTLLIKETYFADASSDGKTLAVGSSSGGDIQLWTIDGAESKNKLTVKSPDSSVRSLAYTKDGSRILVGGPFTVSVLAASNLQTINKVRVDTELFALHPDGKTLVACSLHTPPETILYFDLDTGKPVSCPVRQGEDVASFSLTPDGASLVTLSKSPSEKTRYSIKVWDPKKRKELKSLGAASVSSGPLQISDDGKLVGLGGGGFVTLWSLKDGTRVLEESTRKIPADFIAFGPGGLLAAWSDKKITLWRLP